LLCIACAAQMYCVSGLIAVSPNPPVVPILGAPAAGVDDGAGEVGAEFVLEAGVAVDAPHPATARPEASIVHLLIRTPA
jgi:hypothetical protein